MANQPVYNGRYGYVEPKLYGEGTLNMKQVMYVLLSIIGLILGIYLYSYYKAKKDLAKQTPAEYADEKYTTSESSTIRSISTSIKQDLKGLNITHNKTLYETYLATSDRIFIGVFNDYARLSGNSLKDDFYGDRFSLRLMTDNIYNAIMNRFSLLNLS